MINSIKVEGTTYNFVPTPNMPKRKWVTLYEDNDGVLARKISEKRFIFIAWTDMNDACGRDNIGQSTFVVEIQEVNLETASEKTIHSALRCCGYYGKEYIEYTYLALADTLRSYGAAIPLDSIDSGDGERNTEERMWNSPGITKKLIKQAKSIVNELLSDEAFYNQQCQRTVNKIGSTAMEYAHGNLNAAISRGYYSENPDTRTAASIMATISPKYHGHPDEKDDDPPADFLPYVTGYFDGIRAETIPPNAEEEFSPEYFDGYRRGASVAAGDASPPKWIKTCG